jgi:hypothetical protein
MRGASFTVPGSAAATRARMRPLASTALWLELRMSTFRPVALGAAEAP